eukprot:Sdes_comp20123_c0_seq1m13169
MTISTSSSAIMVDSFRNLSGDKPLAFQQRIVIFSFSSPKLNIMSNNVWSGRRAYLFGLETGHFFFHHSLDTFTMVEQGLPMELFNNSWSIPCQDLCDPLRKAILQDFTSPRSFSLFRRKWVEILDQGDPLEALNQILKFRSVALRNQYFKTVASN